jgi:hypothetical protein
MPSLACSLELADLAACLRAFAVLMTRCRSGDCGQRMTPVAASSEPSPRTFVTGCPPTRTSSRRGIARNV